MPRANKLLLRLILSFFIVITFSSCKNEEAEIGVQIEVKTNQGDPVDKAQVLLDGVKLGETANNGQFSTLIKLPTNSRKRIEIKKDSEKYYFAPYFESFVVTEASKQDINILAVLYFVPKVAPSTSSQDISQTDNQRGSPPEIGLQANLSNADIQAPQNNDVKPTETAANEVAVVETKSQEPVENRVTPETEPPPTPDLGQMQVPVSDDSSALSSPSAEDANAFAFDPNEKKSDQINLLGVESPQVLPLLREEPVYPKPVRPNSGDLIYTVQVHSSEKPISDVQVYLGEETEGDLKLGCTTNTRGRCVIRFSEKPLESVTFVAKKKGYKTAKQPSHINDKGLLRIALEPGQTIDLYAVSKTYNFTSGLKDIEVYVSGKRVGSTDRFGHYAHVYSGKPDDLVAISLKSKDFLPETYETDFVASGPMTLVKYFSPKDPPPVKMSILSVKSAGKITDDIWSKLTITENHIRDAAKQHLFSSSAFKEIQTALFERYAAKAGRSITEISRKGWADTDLKAYVDALLLPTLVIKSQRPALELSIIDSQGKILAAAVENLEELTDRDSIHRTIAQLSKKITRTFPFEGAVLGKEADKITINIGYSAGRSLKSGDQLDIFGVQSERLGRTLTHRKIASVLVKEVADNSTICQVQNIVPRAIIERGDLVALRNRKTSEQGTLQFRILAKASTAHGQTPLSQANLYLNGAWIGASDSSGRLYSDLTGIADLSVIKHGYAQLTQQVDLKPGSKIELTLERESAFLRIDSKPSGINVKIDGSFIGKTPLTRPIAIPSGFVKLELEGPKGFKTFSSVLELDQGGLELTGNQAIQLEPDLRAEAQKLLQESKLDDAIARYQSIPKTHSDWLISQHELGEIYLTLLDNPVKAAEAFGQVTSYPSVKQFTDKRFIGSHVNEAVALFLTAEKLFSSQKEAAIAHYKRAIEIFDSVIPQLRFVKNEQYAQAVHNVDFHRALAKHRVWQISQDPAVLQETIKTWRSYLEGSALSVPSDNTAKSYIENARVYFRQANASTGRPLGVTR